MIYLAIILATFAFVLAIASLIIAASQNIEARIDDENLRNVYRYADAAYTQQHLNRHSAQLEALLKHFGLEVNYVSRLSEGHYEVRERRPEPKKDC